MIRTAKIVGVVSERPFTSREGLPMVVQRLLLHLPYVSGTGRESHDEVLADRFVAAAEAPQVTDLLGTEVEATLYFAVRKYESPHDGHTTLYQDCKISKISKSL